MKYAVVVPAMKDSALARGVPETVEPEEPMHQDHQQAEVHDGRQPAGDHEPDELGPQAERTLPLVDRQLGAVVVLGPALGRRPPASPARPVGRTTSVEGLDALPTIRRKAASAQASPSMARPSASVASNPCRSARLAARRLTGGLGRDLPARASAASRAVPVGTSRSASPTPPGRPPQRRSAVPPNNELRGAIRPHPARQQLGSATTGDQSETDLGQ